MGILYTRYFSHLRLLRSSNTKENPKARALRRSCHVVYTNIRGLHKKLPNLSLISRGGDVIVNSKTIVSSGATFQSFWFQVLSDRCSCSGMMLIVFEV